jgi:hypothetical protein
MRFSSGCLPAASKNAAARGVEYRRAVRRFARNLTPIKRGAATAG